MQPIHVEAGKLWLPCLDHLEVGQTVMQSEHLGTLQQLFDVFAQEWNQRWDRHADISDDRWQPILELHL